MKVMSLRLGPQAQAWISKWAKREKKEKSEAARELLEYGWKFALLERYREGKISLGRLAQEWKMPLSQVMDFLAEHGASVELDYDDYLQGLEHLRKAF